MYKLIHNNSCSKSRECKSILDSKKVIYDLIEYKKIKLSKNQIEEIVNKLSKSSDEIIRKNENEFRENKFDSDDKNKLINFLFKYPNCLQRPIFFNGEKYFVCRPPREVLLYL